MTTSPHDRLYKLLPAIYQIRDAVEGEPLRALLALIEQELLTIEGDITGLYDNWFIETCAEWAVPYIGDLLDVEKLYTDDNSHVYGQQERRAYVANTLAYRRRKGTTAMLEQLTQDVMGWRARAVEFARLVGTTQNLNHIRSNSTTFNLRTNNSLQQTGTPFEQQAAYTAEIRPIRRGGRYSVVNIGLFVWRLYSYPIERSTARAVLGPGSEITGQYYTFNPLGNDAPLFNQPQTETDIITLAQEINVPSILRREVLADELKQRRQLRLQGKSLEGLHYFDLEPVLQLFVNGQPNPIPPEEILIYSLGEEDESGKTVWRIPPDESDRSTDDTLLPTQVVAVDPELGRIAFLHQPWPTRVEVSYSYGFSDDLGGGSYSRNEPDSDRITLSTQNQETENSISPLIWEVKQATSADSNPLATAIQTWNQTVEAWQGLKDSTHIPLARIQIPTVQVIHLDRKKIRPSFSPGIIGKGLRVIVRPGSSSVIVTAGQAVDRQGRLILLERDYIVPLEKFNLTQDAKGWLVIFYRPPSARRASASDEAPIEFVSETAFDEYPPGTFIPLIHLTLNSQRPNPQFDESICRSFQFKPGIVQGLEVKLQPRTLEAVITAGTVVDERGRSRIISNNFSVDLSPYQGEIKRLVLRKTTGWRKQWQIELWNQEDSQTNFEPNCIYLATLEIPIVKIVDNYTDGSNVQNKFFTNTSLQSNFANNGDKGDKGENFPGTNATPDEIKSNGLIVTLVNPERAIIAISPGTVSDEQGQTISLDREMQFDLSAYSGQTLILFISHETKQGLPLTPVSLKGRGWEHLGIVPEEPDEAETGTILIADNCTYEGDLSIVVPAERRLQILAADGCRPHLHGNLSVRGTAIAEHPEPGELLLDGLLVEGRLTVLAGNLKRLNINHCTLVPQQGGLYVEPGWLAPLDLNGEEGFNAITLVMYCLNWVWQSICRDVGLSNASSEFNPTQLLQPALQQLQNRVSQMWQTIQRWRCPHESEPDTEAAPPTTQWDNARLEITLYRSICGPLYLTDTVSTLSIADSIIDKGLAGGKEQQPEAISAPGSEVEIKTTTVLGMTTVRNLEASNSIFTEKVIVMRHQRGCIRFSHVPEASHTPRRYQCQPDMALKAALKRVPTAVTAIQILPTLDNSFVFLGTAGDGVFRFDAQNKERPWEDVTRNLSNRYVTALLTSMQPGIGTISSSGTTVTGTVIANQETTEVSTAFTQQLKPGDILIAANQSLKINEILNNSELKVKHSFQTDLSTPTSFQINTLWVGAIDGSIFCSKNNGETWTKIETKINIAINHLAAWARQGTGTISSDSRKLIGKGTFFSSQVREGDTLSIEEETRIVTALGQAGIGTISSQGITVRRQDTNFNETLQLGDKITAFNQTRIIVKIHASKSEGDWLEINAPFAENLPQGTPFKINIDTILEVNAAFSSNLKEQPFNIHHLLAATLGNGILWANDRGENWEKINTGLTNLNITALAVDFTGQLFAGTSGGGVFQFTSHEEKNKTISYRWIPFNTGLTNLYITALAIDAKGKLWAGTAGNGVFCCNLNEKGWTEINEELTSFVITAIVPVQITGTPNPVVFAGTANGQIFRLIHEEKKWQQLKSDSQGIDITTLTANGNTGDVFAGTASGDILQFTNGSGRWISINQGLPNIAEKLLIMERLQPNFTSSQYGNPSYAQLSQASIPEIHTGAEDGAEMGVFNSLKQPQREANLRASIDENLRFGLEAGIFYIT
ncbi:PQQ-like beta-propeller repeat protein [Leptolyngbya sp. FACHB-671]|uniref:PQQ-like beta-propeller repeat protein n=1 Tax=Leptolyngbya sp. FACHB-671 TaxID=2692812 RepID=UPI001685C287|nr:PQQ-like beta-propeller repeat protein [Leptolyngbya sp. FACHB-671]MBD2066018.1 PQQ-like beta-propeller repeat protein [Leptolyngbya sp. FACHB-671]